MKQTLARLDRRLEELAANGPVSGGDASQRQRIWLVSGRAVGD
jgi:hypothetical protein